MQELVILKNKAVTTSLQVAESFEKKHQHVLRDIDALKKMCPILDRCFLKVMNQIHTAEIDEFSSLVEMVFFCWLWVLQERKLFTSNKNTLKHSTKWKMLFARILFLKQLKI